MGTSCILDIVLIPLHFLPNEVTSSRYFTGDNSGDEIKIDLTNSPTVRKQISSQE